MLNIFKKLYYLNIIEYAFLILLYVSLYVGTLFLHIGPSL